MNILFLGPDKTPQNAIIKFLINDGANVIRCDENLNVEAFDKNKYEYLISFGYRFIISKEVLSLFKEKAINLHISYLPWNKGSDPNLWSILENTIKGVTIHKIDKGLDTGELLFQREIFFNENDTLRSTYDKLQNEILKLFKENWEKIKDKKVIPMKQIGVGSYHKSSDKNNYLKLLTNGWDTKINILKGKALNV